MSLIAAVLGGFISGYFATRSMEMQVTSARESDALAQERSAVVEFLKAEKDVDLDLANYFGVAKDIAVGAQPLDTSALITTTTWQPKDWRFGLGVFPSGRALMDSHAGLLAITSPWLADCASRIYSSDLTRAWEMSDLATSGNFAWFANQHRSVRDRDGDIDRFERVEARLRYALVDRMNVLSSSHFGASPPASTPRQDCSDLPAFVGNSTTSCGSEGSPDYCFDLTDSFLESS
jgi:hypothetical protein